MKLSSILCAPIVALTVFSLTTNSAFAAYLDTSKLSNFAYSQNNSKAEKDCTDRGGKVSKSKDGKKFCTGAATATATEPK